MTASFAAMMGLIGLTDLVPHRNLVRPPGVVREDQFLRSCIRCGACAEVCPVRAVGIANISDGLPNVGTPVLAMPAGYCMVFKGLEYPAVSRGTETAVAKVGLNWKKTNQNGPLCSECIDVCPTAALQPIDVRQSHMGTAVVYKEYCRAWLGWSCTFSCVDVCVFDAIKVTVGPVVDVEKCVGCNQCSYVCLARLWPGPTGIMVEPSLTNK
jgi:ferredoxin